MRAGYNSLKKRVLRILLRGEKWISVPDLAEALDLSYHERGLYSYLRHLAEMGLVVAAKNSRGRLFYRATERGAERLKFLNERK